MKLSWNGPLDPLKGLTAPRRARSLRSRPDDTAPSDGSGAIDRGIIRSGPPYPCGWEGAIGSVPRYAWSMIRIRIVMAVTLERDGHPSGERRGARVFEPAFGHQFLDLTYRSAATATTTTAATTPTATMVMSMPPEEEGSDSPI